MSVVRSIGRLGLGGSCQPCHRGVCSSFDIGACDVDINNLVRPWITGCSAMIYRYRWEIRPY